MFRCRMSNRPLRCCRNWSVVFSVAVVLIMLLPGLDVVGCMNICDLWRPRLVSQYVMYPMFIAVSVAPCVVVLA
eukprot:2897967-Pyramimonas_sp.AAC.1